MGTKISDIINPVRKKITIENLFGKKITIDAFNHIFQFLSIEDSGGNKLTNKNGEITSHLSGLLYRSIYLIEHEITPIYCFDGTIKEEKLRWKTNRDQRNKINKWIIDSSIKLLDLMGINVVMAKGDGESQCSYMVNNGDAFAVASQDYDVLIYGGSRLVRNLGVKQSESKSEYKSEYKSESKSESKNQSKNELEFISLQKLLEHYKITQDQLIDISILSGNDYFSGIKRIGEITALNLISKYKCIENIEATENIKPETKDNSLNDFNDILNRINEVRTIFKYISINEDYDLTKKKPNYEELKKFLIDNDFSEIRVDNAIKRIKNKFTNTVQITLRGFM